MKRMRSLPIGRADWTPDDVVAVAEGRARVSALLARADVFLGPNHAVEGFGLPLVEALGTGAPVIASDLPVFREIGRNIPTYVDPLDSSAWEAWILDYAQPNSDERAAQLQRMREFRAPSWSKHFAAVEQWLAALG